MKSEIPVIHLLADHIRNVEMWMVSHRVRVFQLTLVLRQVVGQNVQLILSVEAIKPVSEKNVKILAPDFVESRLNALW